MTFESSAANQRHEASPDAPKFRIAMAALSGIAVVAIVVAIVVASSGSARRGASTPWSSFRPESSGSRGAWEIAQFVSPYYRTSGSQQLAAVVPMQLTQSTTGAGLTVAVNDNPVGKQSLGLLNDGATVGYEVCGIAATTNCDVAGTATPDRGLLLRREALELALYTFKYVKQSQTVIVVLPPAHTVTASGMDETAVTAAVGFVRANLQPWLKVPLAETLQQYPPTLSKLNLWSKTQEASFVDQLTARSLFSTKVESLQEGGSELVLTPLPAQ